MKIMLELVKKEENKPKVLGKKVMLVLLVNQERKELFLEEKKPKLILYLENLLLYYVTSDVFDTFGSPGNPEDPEDDTWYDYYTTNSYSSSMSAYSSKNNDDIANAININIESNSSEIQSNGININPRIDKQERRKRDVLSAATNVIERFSSTSK